MRRIFLRAKPSVSPRAYFVYFVQTFVQPRSRLTLPSWDGGGKGRKIAKTRNHFILSSMSARSIQDSSVKLTRRGSRFSYAFVTLWRTHPAAHSHRETKPGFFRRARAMQSLPACSVNEKAERRAAPERIFRLFRPRRFAPANERRQLKKQSERSS